MAWPERIGMEGLALNCPMGELVRWLLPLGHVRRSQEAQAPSIVEPLRAASSKATWPPLTPRRNRHYGVPGRKRPWSQRANQPNDCCARCNASSRAGECRTAWGRTTSSPRLGCAGGAQQQPGAILSAAPSRVNCWASPGMYGAKPGERRGAIVGARRSSNRTCCHASAGHLVVTRLRGPCCNAGSSSSCQALP